MKSNRPIVQFLKIAGSVVLIIIGSMIVIVSTFLLFPDFFVNRLAKGQIERKFSETFPAYSLLIGHIHYNVWDNHVVFTSLSLVANDSSFMCAAAAAGLSEVDWLRILRGEDTGHVSTFIRTRVNAENVVLTFPLKGYELRCDRLRISVPDSEIVAERLEFDPLLDASKDSSFACAIASAALSDVDWLRILRGEDTGQFSYLARTRINAENMVLTFPRKRYELRCDRLRISVPDSEIVADTVELRPLVEDAEFFGDSKFRKTRFLLTIPQSKITGYQIFAMMEGKKYAAHTVQLHNASLDVLINKEKPSKKDTASPPMPHEIFSSLQSPIQLDSLNIINARLTYGERFTPKGRPALIRFDDVGITMKGISNRGTVIINAQGLFMKEGNMSIQMTLPLAGPDFSLQYSGSVRTMNLEALNPFLVIAEKMRIKSGRLRVGTFDISIARGRARGSVRAIYKDLTVAKLDEKTLAEDGIIERFTSFLANVIKLRRNNIQEESSHPPKIGKVTYIRKADDPFFRLVWFSLRSGVADIVGF